MATRYKNLPRIVDQVTGDLCWAAALESWLAGNHRVVIPRDSIPGTFPDYLLQIPGTTTVLNYLDATHLRDLAGEHKVRMDIYDAGATGVLTSAFFAAALARGYVYMARVTGSSIGHCSVIYGVGVPEDGKTEMVSYMDPLIGYYRNESIATLRATSTDLKFGVPHGPRLKY